MNEQKSLTSTSSNNDIEQLETLSTVFNTLPIAIFSIIGQDLIITSMNNTAGKILKADIEALIGKQSSEVLYGQFLPLKKLLLNTLINRQPVNNFNLEITDENGEAKNYLASTALTEKNSVAGFSVVLVLHDITELKRWRKAALASRGFGLFIGSSKPMKELYSLIETVAQYDTTVLIYGETGTGKELVARTIHQQSKRAHGPFVPVHCSALTSTIFESELFGHVKGAFSGASENRLGRFEMAQGGTLFLDEISTLSIDIQIKLLRAIQEKAIERVGSSKTIPTDVRIITATNQDLSGLIRNNLFRDDLYYRLKVFQLSLPLLRERQDDILHLADNFIENFNKLYNRNVLNMSSAAKEMLMNYPWPGNVRELENAIEHAMVLTPGEIIEKQYFPPEIRNMPKGNPPPCVSKTSLLSSDEKNIRQTLVSVKWNVSEAANQLGMHRTTLWRKMREYDIERT